MSTGLKILVYLVGTVVLGATIAPWLYWAAQAASGLNYLNFLAGTDFQRIFNRSVLIAAFLLLIPILRWIGLQQFKSLGLKNNPRRISHLLGGFVISAGTISVLGACLVALGIFEFKEPIPWSRLPPILMTAISVSVIEETLFRGAILGLLRQSFTTFPAVVFVSAFFSIVHFLKPMNEHLIAIRWSSGFELLPHAFWQFSDPLVVLGGFTTLGILGLLLAHATIKTSSLWLGIGIHSGLIFGKMGLNKITKRMQDVTPWFGSDITVGAGSILIMLFLWSLIWLIYLRGEPDSSLA